MLTKIMKWVSIAVLLGAVLRRPGAGYEVLLDFVVCISGLLVITQAVRIDKYFWAAGFTVVVILFNPIVPVEFSRRISIWLDLVCAVTFLVSLIALKRQTRIALPEVANRAPGTLPL